MNEQPVQSAFTERIFEYRSVEKKKLILSLSITAVVMVIELIGGFFTRSIALISDAGHMFTHCFALGIGLAAITIAQKPPCHHRTFGLYRAEIVAALINGLFLFLIVVVIIYEAVHRIIHPEQVLTLHMLFIALIGLAVNVLSILILRGSHKKDLNIRGVFYHMVADAASSVGIVIAAIIINVTGWNIIDPLVSIGISAIILLWAWGVVRESTIILLEMAPTGLNIEMISNDLKTHFSEIKALYNAHLWTITPDMLVFSAHMRLDDTHKLSIDQNRLIAHINKYLSTKYNIIESTIQIVSGDEAPVCRTS
jgi:cobalt-zinc-cadmium efflux system protein